MKLSFLWCLLVGIVCVFPSPTSAILGRRRVFRTTSTPIQEKKALSAVPTTRRFNRFLDKLFDEADINHDGTVSFSEAYEMVLKMYVNINRQAPIPAPTRRKIAQLYLSADSSKTNRLNREEFKGLAKILGRRALSRLVAHKLVTLLGAPLLATVLVKEFSTHSWPRKLAHAVVPDAMNDKLIPVLTSQTFGRTLIIVACVATLGNIVLGTVNWLLDMSLPGELDDDPRLMKIVSR